MAMARSSSRRSSYSGPHRFSDVEKDISAGDSSAESSFPMDLEKQKHEYGDQTLQPVPGAGGSPIEDERVGDLEEGEGQPEGLKTVLSKVASRVISRASVKSEPGPPPDGGLRAWLVVLGGHLAVMNTWGFINSFGVFQTYYATFLKRPPSDISWIGSIQIFLLFFVGTFTGRLTDAGYFRQILLLGSVLQVVGIFTASASTEYWQLFLAQGICLGLGNGCLFCPSLAVLSTYFSKRRSIAIGIFACGSATGGLIFPSMARQLLPTAGFGWTVRAIGFVQLAGLIVMNLVMKTRIAPRRTGAFVEWAAFREPEYALYACGSFCCFMGLYFAFYYVASFGRDIIGMSYTDSLNVLLLVNGIGTIGRLGPNYLADRIGAINVLIPTSMIAGIACLSWMAVGSPAGLYVWGAFYGAAGGGIQSLFPAGLTSLTTDLRKAGVRIGMVFTIVSFACLMGSPVGGAIITASGGKYEGAQGFAGAAIFLGTCFFSLAKLVRVRRTGQGWFGKV